MNEWMRQLGCSAKASMTISWALTALVAALPSVRRRPRGPMTTTIGTGADTDTITSCWPATTR